MKRTYTAAAALLLACCIPCASDALPAAADTGGAAGESAFWALEGDTLTLSGTGEIDKFYEFGEGHWVYDDGDRFGEHDDAAEYVYDIIFMRPWEDDCENIRHIVVEEGITSLNDYLFAEMPNLESAVLPQSVTELSYNCFKGCPSLCQITLPDTLTFRSNYFADSPLLFTEVGDFLILSDRFLCRYTGEGQTTVTIPDGIAAVEQDCFRYHTEIEEVILPESVKVIGECAFLNCKNLRQIQLPDGLQIIERDAFEACSALKQISFPDSLKTIDGAFSNSGLEQVTLPEGLQSADGAFFGCGSLKEATLPHSLIYLGGAFRYCYNLERISLTDRPAEYGEFLLPENLTSYVSFERCYKLENIVLPEGIEEIGAAAFECTAIKSCVIPDTCETVGSRAFSECTALERCVIPDTCKYIGSKAFQGCTALKEVVIPNGLTYLSMEIFTGCSALQWDAPQNGFYRINDRYLYRYDGAECFMTIPEGTVLIADSALRRKQNLIAVSCPESMRYLNSACLFECKALTELHLNDGLLEIGTDAISGCTSLTELTIPASVTKIEPQKNCFLTDIYGTPGTAAEQFALENGIAFHDAADREPPQPPQGEDLTLDYEKDGWYFGNSAEAFQSEYYLTDADLAAVQEMSSNTFYAESWSGSCFGLAATVILAKNGLISPDVLQSGAQTLSEVEPTRKIQSVINYYHGVQFSADYLNAVASVTYISPAQRFWSMVQTAKNVAHGASPFMLVFFREEGMHAVVGYGHESGEWTWNGRRYDGRVLIWDPNFPQALNDASCLYYDSVTLDYCIPYYAVSYSLSDAGDNSGGLKTICLDPAALNVRPYPFADMPVAGDLNGDGVLTAADAVLLSRLLAEDETAAPADFSQADFDADGLITLLDITALLRRIASF